MKHRFKSLCLALFFSISAIMFFEKSFANDYPIEPVPFNTIRMSDNYWLPKIKTVHYVTIPHSLTQSAGRIRNFEIAAKLKTGKFQTDFPFDDSDIYKIIEAASYSLYYHPDSALEFKIDSIIKIIGLAQEPDGYLYTCRTMNSFPNDWSGTKRWEKEHVLSHETYNLGHLFESACAYYQATSKDNLLKIAVKAADMLDSTFGWGKLQNYPGHQIVEVGLVRLYRLTGQQKYLDLAKFFLDVRGPGGEEYCQAHKKVVDQTTAVGHSVRAVYMYAGMADVAALINDKSYINAIDKIWDDIVIKKIYVTGGIGASGGNEGFNGDYNLPNASAYCETCASIGNVYLNHRLFLLHGDAKYIDVLERTLYNALLSGISLSGDKFFYPNSLASSGSKQRSTWFSCACCPPNIARLIPSVPGYIYAKTKDTLYVNLFMSDTANIVLNGTKLKMVQTANYPWDGNVKIEISPETQSEFTIMVRIPGWARNEAIYGNIYQFADTSQKTANISINNESQQYTIHKGYAILKHFWKAGDYISLDLPMEARKLVANSKIIENVNKFAVQRGPLVYCAEGVDNNSKVNALKYNLSSELTTSFNQNLLNGTQVVQLKTVSTNGVEGNNITLIPYYLWANRGGSEMQVWLSQYAKQNPSDTLILIDELIGDSVSTNYVSPWENLKSICNIYNPANSADVNGGAFGNWADDSRSVKKWNWVQYNFSTMQTVASSEVYWWKDNAGIDMPDSSYLSYFDQEKNTYVKVNSTIKGRSDIYLNKYNKEVFNAISSKQIRLNFYGKAKAQGILEWKVYKSNSETSVNNNKRQKSGISIFPNPAFNEVNIDLNKQEKAELSVFNSFGNLVLKRNIFKSITLHKKDLGCGVFIVKVSSNGNDYFNKMIFN